MNEVERILSFVGGFAAWGALLAGCYFLTKPNYHPAAYIGENHQGSNVPFVSEDDILTEVSEQDISRQPQANEYEKHQLSLINDLYIMDLEGKLTDDNKEFFAPFRELFQKKPKVWKMLQSKIDAYNKEDAERERLQKQEWERKLQTEADLFSRQQQLSKPPEAAIQQQGLPKSSRGSPPPIEDEQNKAKQRKSLLQEIRNTGKAINKPDEPKGGGGDASNLKPPKKLTDKIQVSISAINSAITPYVAPYILNQTLAQVLQDYAMNGKLEEYALEAGKSSTSNTRVIKALAKGKDGNFNNNIIGLTDTTLAEIIELEPIYKEGINELELKVEIQL